MALSSPRLRRFVHQAMIAAAGVATPTPIQVAAAFDVLCGRLRDRLHPLFGATAISALFARALAVSTKEYSWLAEVLPADGECCSPQGLQTVSEVSAPQLVEEGLVSVLAHDLALLSAFIGEDFVIPLAQDAWGAVSATQPNENTEDIHE